MVSSTWKLTTESGTPVVHMFGLAGGVLYSTALARITTSALVTSSTPLGICETEQASAAIGITRMPRRRLLRNVDQVIGNPPDFGIIVGAVAVGCRDVTQIPINASLQANAWP